MASIGRKILSAFVEMPDKATANIQPQNDTADCAPGTGAAPPPGSDGRFRDYFQQLFEEANLPGPDYFEFSRMTDAMTIISDEKARYAAAFAGLQVQGLSRQQLLASADAYLQVLEKDGNNFMGTVATAMQEQVEARKAEITDTADRIGHLVQEMTQLKQRLAALQGEVKAQEDRLRERSQGYRSAQEEARQRIESDIQKIKIFIQ